MIGGVGNWLKLEWHKIVLSKLFERGAYFTTAKYAEVHRDYTASLIKSVKVQLPPMSLDHARSILVRHGLVEEIFPEIWARKKEEPK